MMSLTKLTMVVVFPLPLTISGFSVSVSDGLSERTFFFLTVSAGYRRGISTRSVFFPRAPKPYLFFDRLFRFLTILTGLGLAAKDRLWSARLCSNGG